MLDVAALQFVGRSISVFLTFNILLCTVYLCWTWLHCSSWSLNISAFSNNLTINQFYLFLCLQHSHLHKTLPPHLTHYFSGDLGTLSIGIPYHIYNTTKVARGTTGFFFFVVVVVAFLTKTVQQHKLFAWLYLKLNFLTVAKTLKFDSFSLDVFTLPLH